MVNPKTDNKTQDFTFRHSSDIIENSIDIKIEGWCCPKSQLKSNYNQYCKNIIKKVKQLLFDQKDKINCDCEYLVDLDLRTAAIAPNKMSYFAFQIMLTPQDNKEINLDLFLILMDSMLRTCDYFEYQKYKLV